MAFISAGSVHWIFRKISATRSVKNWILSFVTMMESPRRSVSALTSLMMILPCLPEKRFPKTCSLSMTWWKRRCIFTATIKHVDTKKQLSGTFSRKSRKVVYISWALQTTRFALYNHFGNICKNKLAFLIEYLKSKFNQTIFFITSCQF